MQANDGLDFEGRAHVRVEGVSRVAADAQDRREGPQSPGMTTGRLGTVVKIPSLERTGMYAITWLTDGWRCAAQQGQSTGRGHAGVNPPHMH
ncbi:hypothetical protein HETIRDRAFT_144946 [Heterobasidion irregulare TC 32-1]|uniref:Uncharacterized protein n=1 Tax=Heterobasidion irregulare (strain TC 32-1) TaxID=747525 RepID=W4JY20_HETIT|nr:uncharacterized protein HETIRDRAFT_144946 [Heterobasidion irregulare TC 32-1]ETW78477.1 hypothetical protein HETIRDRAFT_144946 [Heterobasidion irregulare TC 32-1]